MFLEDTGWFHRLHGGLLRVTGSYPADTRTDDQ